MNRTVEIKKVYIKYFLLSIIAGFSTMYALEHLGSFSYDHNYSPPYSEKPSLSYQVPAKTKVSEIKYTTYFDNIVVTGGNGFDIYDLNYSDTEFNSYFTKSYYYTQAVKLDFTYGFYISLIIFLLTLLFTNLKFKIT